MSKIFFKTIAIIIVFAMVFQLFPNIVLGLQKNQVEKIDKITEESAETQIPEESSKIIGEDVEKRTLNEKHFILENGTKIAAIYPNSVHYEKNGKMVDIDNTLLEVENGNKEKEYTNKNNNFKVNLAKETKDGNLIKIEQNGYEVTWNLAEKQLEPITNSKYSLLKKDTIKNSRDNINLEELKTEQKLNISKAKILSENIETKKEQKNNNEEKMQLKNLNTAVKYSSVLKGVDFKYDIASNTVKESIIIRSKEQIQTEFLFEIKTKGLTAKLQEDNSIILYDSKTNEEVFFIESPYMFDGKLEFSDKIEIELNETEEGYRMAIKPDKEWLLSEDRVYPITIDPTVSSSLDRSNIKDTYIYDGDNNNSTRGNAHILRIGNSKWLGPNGGNPTRALIKFTLPELAAGDQVINATLGVFNYPKTSEWTPPTRELQIDVHRMTANWEENTAYWNNSAANFDTRVIDYALYQYNSSTPNTCYEKVFNITSIAKDWYTTGNNYGVMLKEHNEVRGYTAQADAYFISSDTGTSYMNARPQVTIQYRNQTGLEGYLSYNEQNVGRAGTVYTNNYNGNLVLVHPDLSTPGGRMPVGINHVYNTNDKSENIGYGNGYRLNLSQMISGKSISATYTAHVEGIGWQDWVSEEQIAGTTGQNKRMEAIQIKLADTNNKVKIKYQSYVQGIGWQDWVQNGEISGTTGKYLKMEGIRITLDNIDRTQYSVMYRAHVESIGWQDWVSDGSIAGIVGKGLKIEAIEIKILDKVGTLKYIDEDGTAHYFLKPTGSNYYQDEDGLGLKISLSGTTYTMEDKSGNKSTFVKHADGKNMWHLKEIQDTNGNKTILTLSYNAAKYFKIDQVADAVGNKLSLTYSGDKLATIKDPSNKTITYTYNGENLTQITYPDGLKSKYEYSDNKLVSVQNIDNSKVKYEYYAEKTSRVKKITEYGSSGTIGNTIAITYGQNATKFTDNKGYSNNYVFNDWGQVTSVSDFGLEPENTDKALGKSYEYGNGENKNKLTLESNLMSVSEMPNNLIKNGNFNDGMNNWTKDYNNGNDTVIKIGNNNVYRTTGDVHVEKRCFQDINISGSAENIFTLGTWVKSYGAPYDANKNCSTRIDIHIYRQDGSIQVKSFVIDTSSANWEYFSKQFITDSAYKSIRVYLLYYNNVNDTYFDNIGLFKEEFGQSYTYDKNGNIISTQDLAKQNSTFKYNANSQLTSAINPKGGEYNYEYDYYNKNRLLVATNTAGIKYSFDYDEFGNNKSIKIQENSNNAEILENNEIYYIRAKNSNLYLEQEIESGVMRIVQKEFKQNNENQLWKIIKDENNLYRLSPIGNTQGKTMAVSTGVNKLDQLTEVWPYEYDKSQQWKITKDSNGTYAIISNLSGTERRLTVYAHSVNAGAKMCIADYFGTDSQKFYLEKANMLDIEEGATYKIKSKGTGKYLTYGSNEKVEQQNSVTDTKQQWYVQNMNNGYYRLVNKADRTKVMNVTNGSVQDNTPIQMYTASTNNNQKSQLFALVPIGDKSYYIKTGVTNEKRCIDIDTTTGAVNQWEAYHHSLQSNQLFYFEKIESANNSPYIEEKVEYTSNGNYTSKSIDQQGNATQYTYNQTTGTISQQKNAKQVDTNYTYDNIDRLSKVEQATNNKLYKNEYIYENDRLKGIVHNGFSYNFIYDEFGNTTQVKVGNSTLVTNTYGSNNGNLTSVKYGNNQTISYNYDRFNRTTKIQTQNGNFEYSYDAKSNLKQTKDNVNSTTQNYTYDLSDRLVKAEVVNGLKGEYKYDNNSNISEIKNTLNGTAKTTQYTYDRDNRINNVKLSDGASIITGYDTLSRINHKTISAGTKTYKTEYKYKNTSTTNKTTTILESLKNANNAEIKYTYDVLGNIETISEGNVLKQKYYYDGLNQLIREDNVVLNKTLLYNYDEGGNILSKVEYPYTTGTLGTVTNTINYSYGNTNWKDQLTSYNNKAITYDAIGNPLTYDGNTYTWQNGRQLARIQNTNINLDVTYKYNDSGIRTQKTVNGVTTKYNLEGTKVIYEQTGSNIIYYSYDENGQVIGMEYNNSKYYYVKNAQGDIIGLLDSNLNQIASYTYDSWGKVISVKDTNGNEITDQNNIAHKNPYRYRSYRYDNETGLYYLQSRYYNPEWGRFISGDTPNATVEKLASLGNKNMYSYCDNNPINRVDENGKFWFQIAGTVLGAAVGMITKIVSNIIHDEPLTNGIWGATVGGAVTGLMLTTTLNPFIAFAAGSFVESTVNETGTYTNKNNKKQINTKNVGNSMTKVGTESLIGGTIGSITGGTASQIIKINKGWIKPERFVSSFLGKYAQKSLLQNVVQSGFQLVWEGGRAIR